MPDFTYRPLTLDTYFDKIFYINLAKDRERNKHMIDLLSRYGINNYERIDAVELKKLPPKDKYRNFIKDDAKYILGSLSCRASHIKVVTLAKERNYNRVLILEDDVQIIQDPNKLLTQNFNTLQDWDMLYFGGLIEPFFRNQIVGTYAYCIKNTLFDNILCMAENSGMEMDNFYAKILQHMSYNNNQSGKYNIRIILPFNQICVDNAFASNIR